MATQSNVPKHLVDRMPPTSLLIHISTDQVYDGSTSYSTESTPTNPINAYGRSKLAAEEYIRGSPGTQHVILRSSIIVGVAVHGVERPLFVQSIRDRLQAKEPTAYIVDEWRNPIHVDDICRIIDFFVTEFTDCMMQKAHDTTNAPPAYRYTYNMGGPERLSRLDMALAVADAMGIDGQGMISSCTSDELGRPYRSPPDISMDSRALHQRTGIHCMPFKDMLHDIL